MTSTILSGEQSNTEIVTVFATQQEAIDCAKKLTDYGVDPNQLDIIGPNETNYDRKLEPEVEGVKQTFIKAVTRLSTAGFFLGFLVWGGMYLVGIEVIQDAALRSLIAFVFGGTIAGIIVGGIIAMRPDQQIVIQNVESARKESHWSLVIHSRNHEQTEKISHLLHVLDIKFVRSF